MKRIVLTFGLISGAIMSGMMLATVPFLDRIIDSDFGAVIGYTSMVLGFLLIYFGVRQYRDNVAGGRITFGRAFGVGALIALVGSLCYVATWEAIYFGGLAPDFTEKYAAHAIAKARADGASESQLAKRTAEMEKFAALYRNPALNAAMTLLEPLPVALVISLVTAGVVSRRGREGAPAPSPNQARVLS
jgi:hypothetical protein